MELKYFQTKSRSFVGTKYREIHPQSVFVYKKLLKKPRKRPYVRSKFFKKRKVFLDYFWIHIRQKNRTDQTRRLKFFECALELIKNSTVKPEIFRKKQEKKSIFYRFRGLSKDGRAFVVQIKEDKNQDDRYFISIFPEK